MILGKMKNNFTLIVSMVVFALMLYLVIEMWNSYDIVSDFGFLMKDYQKDFSFNYMAELGIVLKKIDSIRFISINVLILDLILMILLIRGRK